MEAETGVMQSQTKEWQQPQEAGRGKELIFPWNLQRNYSAADILTQPVKLILDIWLPEL